MRVAAILLWSAALVVGIAAGVVAWVKFGPASTGSPSGLFTTPKKLPSRKEVSALIGVGDADSVIALLGRPYKTTMRNGRLVGREYHYRDACYDPISGNVIRNTVAIVTPDGAALVIEVEFD